ncbi:MAG TPA: hypothetical protein VGL70_06130 [Candidatus Binatia bacterium]|jgi:hypothetical protein
MHSTQIAAYQSRPAQSVSAGWVYSYDQPAHIGALPEYLFNFEINLARVGPETALLYAVLEDAFFCFQKQFEVRMRPIQRQAARDAEKWFLSNDSRDLFSFISVCTVLGLEPEFIRKKLKHRRQTSLDTVAGKI